MANPEMTPVDSTGVAAIGYDSDTQELYVELVDGGACAYLAPGLHLCRIDC
jgi:hypothetical protein